MTFSFLSLLLSVPAQAVPLQLNQQGRLLDDNGEGLSGSNQMIFKIYDSEEGGDILWSDTLTSEFRNGYYSVLLGTDDENNPLDSTVLEQYPLYLELTLNGEVLSPRHALSSVPYAQIAGVAESVDGGAVNASEVNINGVPVIDGNGDWVGTAPDVDFMSLSNRPPGLDDGDDDTQLDQQGVVNYVNGSQVNLGAASQVDGSDIVTADSFAGYLPADVADGDADTLAGISCATGEILSWDGSSSWVCTSDATLEWADIENMLVNNAVDLNAGTTIDGNAILTSVDDSDTLMGLSCGDGEVAKYDATLMEWYCDIDIDTDTVLSDTEVLGFVNGQALSLGSGTQVDGSDVVTVDTFAANLPADLADGDADTLAGLSCGAGEIPSWDGSSSWVCTSDATLDESTVEGYITNGAIDLYAGSQVDGNAILSSTSQLDWNKLDNVPNGLADGDDNTQLGQSEVVSYVEAGSVNLAQNSQVNSRNIVGQPSVCSNGQVLVYNSTSNDWECGDDTDTTLTPTEMQTMIEALSLNLQNVPQVNGEDVLTTGSTVNIGQIDGTGGSAGQILITDGSSVSWGDAASGGCEESMISHFDGTIYIESNCDGYSYVLKDGGPTNSWISNDQCTLSYLEYKNNGVITVAECGSESHVIHGNHISSSLFSSISVSQSGACGILQTGEVQCWGSDSSGRISNTPSGTFQHVKSGNTNCALDSYETLTCWGYDAHDQIANTPTGTVLDFTIGSGHICAINSNENLECWGYDKYNQVTATPGGTYTTVQSHFAAQHTCAIKTDDSVTCWGRDNTGVISGTPSGSFTSINVGRKSACGLKTNGEIECWGDDSFSQVADTPTGTYQSVFVTGETNCALSTQDQFTCWGKYGYSQVPAETFTSATGYNTICGLNTSDHVTCWGNDSTNQVTNTPSGTFTDIQGSYGFTCGILNTGNVICWGSESDGQISGVP